MPVILINNWKTVPIVASKCMYITVQAERKRSILSKDEELEDRTNPRTNALSIRLAVIACLLKEQLAQLPAAAAACRTHRQFMCSVVSSTSTSID